MDTFRSAERSKIMRAVRSSGTRPEQFVRSLLRKMHIRYRTHARNLPGKPDLVVHGQQKAIFVHGCFWHGHDCEAGRLPKSNRDYWKGKQARNARRDSSVVNQLRLRGWKTMVIWECQLNRNRLANKIARFVRSEQ